MQAQQSITIGAPIEVEWATLTDIEQWPHWQAAVSGALLKGELEPSAEFFWQSGGMKIRSRIQEINAPCAIRWSGRALGTWADHSWFLTESANESALPIDPSNAHQEKVY